MELNINGDVLLLGEANFSFSLSLVKYCDPKYITATCFESKEDARKRYGTDSLDFNVSKLLELNCKRVLFEIDACKLDEQFVNEKFNRIIFMFPHVSGRSNLKKNRELIDKFLLSAKKVMGNNSSVFIALAKGQGGTGFEQDPEKRHNKDSWQILQLAAKHGLILTDCYKYDENQFDHYKSTGFRSQSKSFATKSGLVHKFEISLPILPVLNKISLFNSNLSILKRNFLEKTKYFIDNNKAKRIHPLNEVSKLIAINLNKSIKIDLNLIDDKLEFNLTNSNNYEIEDDLINHFQINSINRYFLRSSMLDIINHVNKINSLNFVSGLVIKSTEYSLFETIEQLNNIYFETLIHFLSNDTKESFINIVELIKTSLINIFESLFEQFGKQINIERLTEQITDNDYKTCFLVDSNKNHAEKLVQTYVYNSKQEYVTLINTSLLLSILFDLNDQRILYCDDDRNLINNSMQKSDLTMLIKRYSIENTKWFHDLSFWYDPHEFNYTKLIDTIRDTCFGLVKSVRMLDTYEETDPDNNKRYAVCLRLEYESCDKALSWKDSVELQYQLRDKVKLFNKLVLR